MLHWFKNTTRDVLMCVLMWVSALTKAGNCVKAAEIIEVLLALRVRPPLRGTYTLDWVGSHEQFQRVEEFSSDAAVLCPSAAKSSVPTCGRAPFAAGFSLSIYPTNSHLSAT
jgi:hypothetical protein